MSELVWRSPLDNNRYFTLSVGGVTSEVWRGFGDWCAQVDSGNTETFQDRGSAKAWCIEQTREILKQRIKDAQDGLKELGE